jgi:hypothetical protein
MMMKARAHGDNTGHPQCLRLHNFINLLSSLLVINTHKTTTCLKLTVRFSPNTVPLEKIDLSVKLPHAKLLGTLLEATSRKRINKKIVKKSTGIYCIWKLFNTFCTTDA